MKIIATTVLTNLVKNSQTPSNKKQESNYKHVVFW